MNGEQDPAMRSEFLEKQAEVIQQTDLEKEFGKEGVILGTFLYLARSAGGAGISVSDIARSAGLSTDEQTIKLVQEVLFKYGYRQVRQFETDKITRGKISELEEETARLNKLKAEFMELIETTKMYELKAIPMKSAKDVTAIREARIQIQIQAVELTSTIPISDSSTDILAFQTNLNKQARILSEIEELLKSIPKLRRVISKYKKDARPVGEDGNALYTIEQPRRSAGTHVITGLDTARLSSLVLDHMTERNGGNDFGLGESSSLSDKDNAEFAGGGVVEPDEDTTDVWEKDDDPGPFSDN